MDKRNLIAQKNEDETFRERSQSKKIITTYLNRVYKRFFFSQNP